MGPPQRSRSLVLLLPILVLLSSLTVLFGAGEVARITSPSHRAKVSGTVEVTTQIDTSGSVAYVVLVVDDTRPAATNTAPWTFELDTRDLKNGPHAVSVEAYNRNGMIAASDAITIIVSNQAAQPAPGLKQPLTVAKQPVPVVKQPRGRKAATAAPAPRPAQVVRRDVPRTPMVAPGPAPEPARTISMTSLTPRAAEVTEAGFPAVAASSAVSSAPTPPVPPQLSPSIVMNGAPLETDVSATVVGGRVHGGLRALFAAAGARVEWLPERRTARVVMDAQVVEVPIGSRIATVNGRQMDMGTVATLVGGRTVVPLRFFAQVTGSRVTFETRTCVARVVTPTYALASVPASLPTAASALSPASDAVGARTPILGTEERGP